MFKFRVDVISYVLVAVVMGTVIWYKGDTLGLESETQRAAAISVLCGLLLLVALYFGFESRRDEAQAAQRLARLLRQNADQLDGTTQSLILGKKDTRRNAQEVADLEALCRRLKDEEGWRWRYRRPWLLLTGDDAALDRLLPGFGHGSWLLTPDAVLLSHRPVEEGTVDAPWLKRLCQCRRRRPVDAVVIVTDGNLAVPEPRRSSPAWRHVASRIAAVLRWSAPTFVLEVAMTARRSGEDTATPIVACECGEETGAGDLSRMLLAVRDQLASRSLSQRMGSQPRSYLARLSQRLDHRADALAAWLSQNAAQRRRAVHGIVFAPYPPGPATSTTEVETDSFLWQYLTEAARRHPGRRTVWHPLTIGAGVTTAAVVLWTTAMLLSAVQNHHDLRTARQAVQTLDIAKANPETRLQALDTLQQHIQRYEHRLQNSAPLFTRFGMNRDAEALAALWKPYAAASHAVLVTPVVQDMEATLVDLAQLQVQGLTDETSRWALDGRDTLKAYLMLAHPERVEPDFLAQQLARHWSTEARITPGRKQDLAERLARFYADHLRAHPDWRVTPRAELVAGARQTLLAVIGERNAVDTIYQTILEGAGRKYPDLTLAALAAGTDTRGLVRATGAVPGVFTRQGYEGYVEAAIEKATRSQDVAHDWVLTDGQPEAAPSSTQPSTSADALRDALAQRYFADYAEHWQQFMNGLQWEPATTLPGVVDQLKLLADARQSPVIALMKSLAYQGGAGARKDSLSDTLVAKAQGILGRKDEAPETVRPDPAGPLGAAFGPVLRLAGQPSTGNTGGSELSLQRYLDRVTAVRLRLQQMTQSADANALARQMAQSLFQGKGSDLADTQAYARLMAASLGAEWAGMGEALFVRPVVQAEQSVLQPAQASLNEAWRRSIALPWQRAFAGRYPFAATANDASLPEMARYIRPQSGLINTFLLAELAGVLALQGDQWVPVGSGTGLTFDPAFLKSINTLQRIGAHLLVQGEPRYQFELRPIPTPGLTDTRLTLDRQTLHYYNQRETWQAMSWPAANLQEPRTLLQWQTERAGTNKTLEIEGVWAWVRMLEQARVTPIDSATVQLTFHARPDTGDSSPGMAKPSPEPPDSAASLLPRAERVAAPATLVHPIHYQMRTAVGRGPLEALELRDLRLPERIFVDRAAVPARPLNSGSRTLRPRPNGFHRSREGGHDSDVVSAFSSSSNTRAVAPLAASENSSSEWAVTW
ncbi:ImcF-related family protein [Cupriavidus sp. SZY C1]|uniref:ImcF-related family protein n=1 Tax=Cupriavidus sp. SZY C1 TaxID=3055037 RepID=UPI0028B508DF|nr:ImcF-related family protein [Cupriavidus sp. SZY C1]MDT6962063.1 ImcF-related family protein [Cupriavidus sp. SZY C1]